MQNYFTTEELKCPCCDACEMSEDFLFTLNHARRTLDFPLIVESGFRCKKHNREVGSTSTNHLHGKAVDVRLRDPLQKFKTVQAFMLSGMTGIGIGKTYIHADTNHEKPTLWIYSNLPTEK